jgi:urease accessory protein
MLQITQRLSSPEETKVTLTLPFELRQKSRLRVSLDDGREAAVILPRGRVLRSGDCLRAEDGSVIRIQAAEESVSTASSADPLLLARVCYHLGNRHVALQVGPGWCRYLHDHVLDEMVIGLGMDVREEKAPFEPESGAYGHAHTNALAPPRA